MHTIDPHVFYNRMAARWVAELGNVYTGKLGMQWAELANVFNSHITAHDDPQAHERYTVVAAALGSGKTQGAILYCALLAESYPDEEQPGVLIVTRRIQDADEIARTINQLAGRAFAFAYHSELVARTTKLSDLAQYPVVVVTHRGYQIALDQMSQGAAASCWPEFSKYRDRSRKLNVIDEAIDLVEHDNVTIEGLKKAIGWIPEAIRREHLPACVLLEETLEHFRSPDAFKIPDGRRAALYEALKGGIAPDFGGLHQTVCFTTFKRYLGVPGETIKESILKTLRAVERVFRQWSYVMKLPTGEQTLHTARLILPSDTKGAVILDATARANTLYRLFGDRIEVRSLPFHTRSYKNLKLHVSRGHKTGKGYIVKNADDAAKEIIANLTLHLGAGRKALLVTHKDAEASLSKYATPFERFTTHWGAIDGSNEWRDCDAVCILSLPRRPDSWATSSYFAITGDIRDEILGDEGDRMRQDIRIGQVVSDVAQAIGRTRCRKVIDEDGNCDPVDVFLFLPDTVEGAAIAKGIRREFHDCQYADLEYVGDVTRVKPKASRIEDAFMVCLRGLPKGTTTAKELRQGNFKGCSPRSWGSLAAALRDQTSAVHQEMVKLGVAFLPGKRGRGFEASFVRA
jgi:hypothetical protein